MSEPREPCFEDDFDCDTDPYEHAWRPHSIMDIAIDKAHFYAQDLGVNDSIYRVAKNAYQDGFLAGFAFRMGGGIDGDTL